ncbi:MAG: hypothetical protein ACE1Y4_13690, partial [Lysobacterales bacterium]
MSRPMRIAQQITLVLISGSLPLLAGCAGNPVPAAQVSTAQTPQPRQVAQSQPVPRTYGQVADPVADPAPVRLAS